MAYIDKRLEEFIKGSSYLSLEKCQRDIEAKTQPHKGLCSIVFAELNRMLNEYRVQNQLDTELYPELDTHETTQIKSWESIVKKIGEEPKKYSFQNFHREMKDILRFRILCNYLSEVTKIKDFLLEKTEDGVPFKLLEQPRDYINIIPKERAKGHRAVHLFFEISPIKFEVQIMAPLQHGWDKKEHGLRYKRSKSVQLDEEIKFFAMSELLYIADEFFDSLKKEIDKRRGK